METSIPLRSQSFVTAADHGGFALKNHLFDYFKSERICNVTDLGVFSPDRADFPHLSAKVVAAILSGEAKWGVLVCGTGLGMSIAANRHHGIYAALCHDTTTARLAREHNDANILVLGGRLTGPTLAEDIFKVFSETPFLGGRYQDRIGLIDTVTVTAADPKLAC